MAIISPPCNIVSPCAGIYHVISENNVLYSDIVVCNTSPVRDSMLSQSDTLQEIYDDFKGTNSSSNRKRKKRQVGPGPGPGPTQPGILHSLVSCL